MIIDTHAHLNFPDYKEDREEVIKRMLRDNIKVINVGVNYQTSKEVVKLAEKENLFASVGLHPINIDTDLIKQNKGKDSSSFLEKAFDYNKYKKLIKSSSKIVMLGEIGLDYWRRPKTNKRKREFKKEQKDILQEQLKLAEEIKLPVNLHCRKAHDDLIDILKNFNLKGVIHCFTGNKKQAKKYLEMGFYLGINGIIFKLDLDEIIKETPLDKMFLETDSPYLTPPGVNSKRNEPIFVRKIAERVAEIKGVNLKEVTKETTYNVKNLLKI